MVEASLDRQLRITPAEKRWTRACRHPSHDVCHVGAKRRSLREPKEALRGNGVQRLPAPQGGSFWRDLPSSMDVGPLVGGADGE